MADNLETMDNFSIQGTMEMGIGNQELLEGLFEPETASSKPEDISPIIKEADPPSPLPKPDVQKGKEVMPLAEDASEKEKGQALISNFLGDNAEENEEEIQKPSVKDPEDIETQENQFTALSNDLYKLGVFTTEEGEEATPVATGEEFLEKFNSEKKKGANEIVQNFIGQFGEDYQEAFDAIFVKGVNPKEYFTTYNNVVGFAEMDLADENNQVSIMKQALTNQGYDPEDIESEIDRLRNYGDLESVATKHHKVLVKKEASKLQELEAKSEQELIQKQNVKNQYIKNVQGILQDKIKEKEFDGIPINPKLAGELQDFLLVDKWKTPSGETLTDFDRAILDMKKPENHAMKVKVGLLLKMLEKDPTLSSIQKTGVSKTTNQLFTSVARQVTKDRNIIPAKKDSWFS